MANEEQLSILKQGVNVWNDWRWEHLSVDVDLSRANLRDTNLSGINLEQSNLSEADLTRANLFNGFLSGANLSLAKLPHANFQRADLSRANLSKSDLYQADFNEARLPGTNLTGTDLRFADLRVDSLKGAILTGANLLRAILNSADLTGADLQEADLNKADLTDAQLHEANLSDTILVETNLTRAKLRNAKLNSSRFGGTILCQVDLSETKGLEWVGHLYSSYISTDTVQLSKGKIPEVFLRGCGLSDWEIETMKLYNPDLSNDEFIDIQNRIFDLRQRQAIQVSPLFISYSHADGEFIDKIGNALTEKGIRYWRDVRDAKAGRLETQIDRAITQNRTVLLVLSEHSIKSDWVEHEVRTARGLEKDMGRDVLCPVALDGSWKSSPWPARLMEQIKEYNILDFSAWQDDVKFEGMFRKLIDGLELFYKDKSHGK